MTLQSELERSKQHVAKLEATVRFWQSNFGVDPPASTADFEQLRNTLAGQKLREELARGFPKCDDHNVLADVSMVNGDEQLVVAGSPLKLLEWSRAVGARLPKRGDVLIGPMSINSFLQGIAQYYAHLKEVNQNCRFDYTLRYATDHDYREGRKRRFFTSVCVTRSSRDATWQ